MDNGNKQWVARSALVAVISGALLVGYGAWRYTEGVPSIPAQVSTERIAESRPMNKRPAEVPSQSVIGSADLTPMPVEQASQGEDEKTIKEKTINRGYDHTSKHSTITQLNRQTSSLNPSVNMEPILLYPKRPQIGENVGALYIPSIQKSLPIIHGTDEDELEKGVGHYADSVLPGEPDHSILSGHRDTVFRGIGDVQLNDLLIVTTSAGVFTYEVIRTYIVDQNDTTVIEPTLNATLSLSTCYPFNFIGNAPQRYVIHSVLVDYQLKNSNKN